MCKNRNPTLLLDLNQQYVFVIEIYDIDKQT